MPTGPRGAKRPADVIAATVMAAKIATGGIEEELEPERDNGAKRAAGLISIGERQRDWLVAIQLDGRQRQPLLGGISAARGVVGWR